MKQASSEKGSVAIYIVLVLSLFMMLSALLLMNSLSRQARISREILNSERSFYAANSGIEQMMVQLIQENEQGSNDDIHIDDSIEYDNETAEYNVFGYIVVTDGGLRSVPCIESSGKYREEQRTVERKPASECNRP